MQGIGNMKSSTNLLSKEERINLTKINMMNNDPKQKFVTHHHSTSTENSVQPHHNHSTSASGTIGQISKGQHISSSNGLPNAARNNLQIHRITSQQDHKAHQ